MENRRAENSGREVRFLASAGLKVERRAEGASSKLFGRAIVYDQWTTLYEGKHYVWRERIMPGACKLAIAEGQDVRCLFNHDSNYVLGRTRSGTLRLAEDESGLMIEADAPDTPTIRDLVLSPIERGDISGMSFAFLPRPGGETVTMREDGNRTIEEREITSLDLFDVSPVTYPAYEQTSVALRSLGERRERELCSFSARRLARMRLRQKIADALPLR